MTPSVVVDPIAGALCARAEGVELKPYKWAPTDIKPPCVVLELPAIRRTGVDQREDHLGQTDWTLSFPTIFYFALDNPATAQPKALEFVESFIFAIDADNGLGGLCQEAKVVEVAEPEFVEDQANAPLRWPARVEVLTFA